MGNLGKDPELRETRNTGTSVCNFRLATNTRSGKGEQRRTHTEWHSVVAWGRLAEICAEYLHAGSKVYIEGHLQTKKRQDRTGIERTKTEIVADHAIFLNKGALYEEDEEDEEYEEYEEEGNVE